MAASRHALSRSLVTVPCLYQGECGTLASITYLARRNVARASHQAKRWIGQVAAEIFDTLY